jgi:hypothetical protein
VKAGIALYQSGQYGAAAETFAQAEQDLPEEPRIALDRAAALGASGKSEQAVQWFRKAAATAEPEVASAAHYNLACLATHAARAALGSQPEEAPPAARERCLRLLDEAESEDRACLRLDANHADARYSLEVILLWRPRMQQAWQKRDRQPDRGPPPSKVEQPHSHPKQRGGESQQNPEREPDRPEKSGQSDTPKPKPPEPEAKPDADRSPEGPENGDSSAGSGLPPATGRPSVRMPQDPAEQRADSLMEKVRQRQRERLQWERQLYLRQDAPVDKDW